ncbi:MAG: VacJ family lipoprotein [Geminicoccaceae bacterium]|nr:VacJ family lipoprotein [Geminicoccaceae bacterium]
MRSVLPKLALATLLLSGCAGTPDRPLTPARHVIDEIERPDDGFPSDIYDPFEGFNRGSYTFNAKFDEYVFLPVVYGYRAVMPDVLEDRVHDFFSNLSEIPTFVNSLLQLNFDHAGRAAHRFLVNSTVGLLGFVDIATLTGTEQEREDFGQTLGVWGLGEGPYIVLPILGPSNLRDATGLAVTAVATAAAVPPDVSDTTAYEATAYGLRPIDTRNNVAFRYYSSSSPFEYELVRLLYTQKRQFDILR